MPEQPRIDPYPEPVALTAIHLAQVNRKQAEKGRADRLRRLARRNRDVAWLMAEHQRLLPKVPKKAVKTDAK